MLTIALIVLVAVAMVLVPLPSEGQRKANWPRVGILTPHPVPMRRTYFEAFKQGFHDPGYAEGHNIAVEIRSAEGKHDRLPILASELVGLNVRRALTKCYVRDTPCRRS
jgi:putative tryptophan/tyrosine transport system substrate-binding protein